MLLLPSTAATSPSDVRYSPGQYLTDVGPGTKTPAQLSRILLGHPFAGRKFSDYVEIDVDGLRAVTGRPGIFVVPGTVPLELTGRLVDGGRIGDLETMR